MMLQKDLVAPAHGEHPGLGVTFNVRPEPERRRHRFSSLFSVTRSAYKQILPTRLLLVLLVLLLHPFSPLAGWL
jgi:hypothetical protein